MKRRHFLKISAGATLAGARKGFARELGALRLEEENRFDTANELYSVAPRIVYFNHA